MEELRENFACPAQQSAKLLVHGSSPRTKG